MVPLLLTYTSSPPEDDVLFDELLLIGIAEIAGRIAVVGGLVKIWPWDKDGLTWQEGRSSKEMLEVHLTGDVEKPSSSETISLYTQIHMNAERDL